MDSCPDEHRADEHRRDERRADKNRPDGQDEEETPSILEEEPDTEQTAAAADGDGGGALESLLDGLDDSGGEEVSVESIVYAFEHRSIGALISVIALISVMPVVGGIPGVTIITATLILMVVAQSLFHRQGGIWVPDFIGRRSIKAETLRKGVDKARPYVRKVDRWMYPRLVFLTHGRLQRLVMTVAIVVLTLSWYFFNFIPWAVTAPGLAVLAFGLALMTGDGLLALFAYIMTIATIGLGVLLVTGVLGGSDGLLSHLPLIGD